MNLFCKLLAEEGGGVHCEVRVYMFRFISPVANIPSCFGKKEKKKKKGNANLSIHSPFIPFVFSPAASSPSPVNVQANYLLHSNPSFLPETPKPIHSGVRRINTRVSCRVVSSCVHSTSHTSEPLNCTRHHSQSCRFFSPVRMSPGGFGIPLRHRIWNRYYSWVP